MKGWAKAGPGNATACPQPRFLGGRAVSRAGRLKGPQACLALASSRCFDISSSVGCRTGQRGSIRIRSSALLGEALLSRASDGAESSFVPTRQNGSKRTTRAEREYLAETIADSQTEETAPERCMCKKAKGMVAALGGSDQSRRHEQRESEAGAHEANGGQLRCTFAIDVARNAEAWT